MPKFDDRFARQNRYAPPPEFPLASCYSGIVHHLSGPNIHAQTQIFLQSIMIGRWCGPTPKGKPSHLSDRSHLYFHYAPRVCHPNARTHVRLLGPCFKTGRLRPFRQDPEHACTGAKSAPRQPASTASSTEGSKDTDNTTACTKARAMKPRSQAGWKKGLRHLTHSERSQATEPKPVYRAIRTDPDKTTPTR